MYTELAEDTLQQIVADHDKVVVQYGATWCGNCRIMKPKFKKLAAANDEIPFLYVDAEKLPESRKLAKVDNLPTFAIFKNGEPWKGIKDENGNFKTRGSVILIR